MLTFSFKRLFWLWKCYHNSMCGFLSIGKRYSLSGRVWKQQSSGFYRLVVNIYFMNYSDRLPFISLRCFWSWASIRCGDIFLEVKWQFYFGLYLRGRNFRFVIMVFAETTKLFKSVYKFQCNSTGNLLYDNIFILPRWSWCWPLINSRTV